MKKTPNKEAVDRTCKTCNIAITTGSHSGYCRKCVWGAKHKTKKINFVCEQCGQTYKNYPCRKGVTRYCSRDCFKLSRFGKTMSPEWKKRNREVRLGNKSHFWRGGVTLANKLARGTAEYREWRLAVFERDDYTCVCCGARSSKGKNVYLQADHIKPFATYPGLRFDLQNGRTLCIDCHKQTDTFAGKMFKKQNCDIA